MEDEVICGPELGGEDPAAMTYNVIRFLGDTEIVATEGGKGEYLTFEAAKAAAIDYLEAVIDLCELTIDGFRDADTPEQYFGTEGATLPEPGSNVRVVCSGCYQPDPEVQGKPLAWFVGKLVKLEFPVPGEPPNGELMWVAVTSVRGDELVGLLDNDPLFADQSYGDEIVFGRDEVLVVDESGVGVKQAC